MSRELSTEVTNRSVGEMVDKNLRGCQVIHQILDSRITILCLTNNPDQNHL